MSDLDTKLISENEDKATTGSAEWPVFSHIHTVNANIYTVNNHYTEDTTISNHSHSMEISSHIKDNGTTGSTEGPLFSHSHTVNMNTHLPASHFTKDMVISNHSHSMQISSHLHTNAYYQENLPEEVNIFSNIPDGIIYKERRVTKFFDGFILSLHGLVLNNFSFPKLNAYISDDNAISINWVFNYFRVYFSFERDPDADNYGMIERLPSYGSLNIQSRQLNAPYTQAINDVLKFVLARI